MSKQTRHLMIQLLGQLFTMASRGQRPTHRRLEAGLGVDADTLLTLLSALDRAGWVDAERLRLTLSGLAVAVSTSQIAAQHSHPRLAA